MTDVTRVAPILIPFDGSTAAESALPFVAALAGREGRVVLLQAVPEPRPIRDVLGDVVLAADHLLALARDAAAADLARAEERLRRDSPTLVIACEVVAGEAATVIVEAAARHTPRLVIAATRGRGETLDGELGTVADRLSGACPAPLLLVDPSAPAPPPLGRFVLGLDGSDHALAALDVVADFARHLGAPVHLVTVVESGHPEPSLDRPELLDERLAEGLNADARLAAQDLVERAGAHLMRQGIHASWEVRGGSPATELPAACDPGDLLVVATHGQSGATRWELGNVARRLLRASTQPTLLIRTVPTLVVATGGAEPAAPPAG